MKLPPPVLIEIAIEPTFAADRERFGAALAAFAAEDSALRVVTEAQSGQTILGGISEAQLDATIDALKRTCRVNVGAPQVAYRETMTRRVEKDYTYKTRIDGGQFARVKIIFEPHAEAMSESKIVGGAVLDDFMSGVETGIASVMRAGPLAGFPVVGVRATLVDGAYHERDSSVLTFEIAARAAFREALSEGQPMLLEPIMSVEVTVPADYAGFVMGDLRARRCDVQRQEVRDDVTVIVATVPLANLFGYANQLRSGTQGHGTFTMRFFRYDPAPPPGGGRPPPAVAAALRA